VGIHARRPAAADPFLRGARRVSTAHHGCARGNSTVASETYTIDAVAPRLVSTTPQAGAGAVEQDALIQLTFDEALVAEGLADP
jgi:hypothetical protein